MNLKKIILALIIFLIIFFLFYFKANNTEYFIKFTKDEIKIKASQFEKVSLEARAAIVFDVNKNEPIFEMNSRVQLPLASLTKIMTVLVVQDYLPQNAIVLQKKLFDDVLVKSSNKSANTIALMAEEFNSMGGSAEFIKAMNKKAEDLGLSQTYFLNETGLDIVDHKINGGYGSVFDIAKLISYAVKNNYELFEPTSGNFAENTNLHASTTIGLIASKTGFTDLAGGNLAIVFDAGLNYPVAIAVFGSSKDGRFQDVQKLINATFEYLKGE